MSANAVFDPGFCKPNFYGTVSADLKEIYGAPIGGMDHDTPHKSSGAVAPRVRSAACSTGYVWAGNFWRLFHIGTVEGFFNRFVSLATAFAPPSSSITSGTVVKCFVMG